MKRLLIALLFAAAVSSSRADLLLAYDFTTYGGGEPIGTSTVAAAGITDPSFITRGTNIAPTANADRFNANGWDNFADANTANTGGDYFEWSISTTGGNSMSITSVFIQLQRSNTGASNMVVRSSVDNFATDIGGLTNFTGNNVTAPLTIDTSGMAALQGTNGTVTFRVVGYTGAAGGSMGFEGSGNDIQIFGTVIPEPASMLLFGTGAGVLAMIRRRRHAAA